MKLFKKTVITRMGIKGDEPYLIRWSLVTTPWFTVKLHKILLSDDDCIHDHPWNYLSIILKGGYTEIRRFKDLPEEMRLWVDLPEDAEICRWFGAGSILWRPAPGPHRLALDKPVWTLVLTSGKKREWGFYTKNGWIPWFKHSPQNSCES